MDSLSVLINFVIHCCVNPSYLIITVSYSAINHRQVIVNYGR